MNSEEVKVFKELIDVLSENDRTFGKIDSIIKSISILEAYQQVPEKEKENVLDSLKRITSELVEYYRNYYTCDNCGGRVRYEGAIGLCWDCFTAKIDTESIKERAREIKPILETLREIR